MSQQPKYQIGQEVYILRGITESEWLEFAPRPARVVLDDSLCKGYLVKVTEGRHYTCRESELYPDLDSFLSAVTDAVGGKP